MLVLNMWLYCISITVIFAYTHSLVQLHGLLLFQLPPASPGGHPVLYAVAAPHLHQPGAQAPHQGEYAEAYSLLYTVARMGGRAV